jgi:uncharacterized protein YcfJ
MATKSQKVLGSIIGVFAGGIIANNYAKSKNIALEERWKYILGGIGGGLATGYVGALVFGSPNDTVNYQLFNGKKRVYHGITFEHRIGNRKCEHIASGKKFTRMIIDTPKPRVEALDLERSLIKKHMPIYNIQHNC